MKTLTANSQSGIRNPVSRPVHREPAVSVILCTYNRPEMLREAVDSILVQEFDDWELILVDNGSTDETPEIITEYCMRDPRIRAVRKSNEGVASGRNAGVQVSRGRYFCFLDDDDLYTADKLKRQFSFMERFPNCGMVYSPVLMVNYEKQVLRTWPEKPATNFKELIRQCTIQPNSMMLRRECLDEAGLFDTKLTGSDDYDMWLRVARTSEIKFLAGAVGLYRWHDGNISHLKGRRLINLLNVYRKWRHERISLEDRAELTRTVLFLTYHPAMEAMKVKDYRKASFYYLMSLYYSPFIGIRTHWGRMKNIFYRLLKPYLALFYCYFAGLFRKAEV